jgi:glutamate synthase domain-containing protein 3
MQRHIELTGSPHAAWILEHWSTTQARFIKVFPHEHKRVLGVPRIEAVYISPSNSSPMVTTGQVHHG